MKYSALLDPGQKVPVPQVVASVARGVAQVASKLGVLGWGGPPPADLSKVPDPDGLLDKGMIARAGSILRAADLFSDEMKPLAAEVAGLSGNLALQDASWNLYSCAMDLMGSVVTYRLVGGAAHRLVLARTLQAVSDVLKEPDLPQKERDALLGYLGQLQGLLSQDLAALRATRSDNADQQAQVNAQISDLQDEEQLVQVMMKMSNQEQVSGADLARAGATYQKLLDQSQQPPEELPAPAPNKRRAAR